MNCFGLRREAKRHAAFDRYSSCGKQCRRCAPVFAALCLGRLPPQILAPRSSGCFIRV